MAAVANSFIVFILSYEKILFRCASVTHMYIIRSIRYGAHGQASVSGKISISLRKDAFAAVGDLDYIACSEIGL